MRQKNEMISLPFKFLLFLKLSHFQWDKNVIGKRFLMHVWTAFLSFNLIGCNLGIMLSFLYFFPSKVRSPYCFTWLDFKCRLQYFICALSSLAHEKCWSHQLFPAFKVCERLRNYLHLAVSTFFCYGGGGSNYQFLPRPQRLINFRVVQTVDPWKR